MSVAHWDEVEGERAEVGHLAGVWYDLGEAAGMVDGVAGGAFAEQPAAPLTAIRSAPASARVVTSLRVRPAPS